jgi:hypothetical protein
MRSPRPQNEIMADDGAGRESALTGMHDHAMADLRFIRGAMERAGAFTAVPGWGGMAMGATALAAAAIASRQPTPDQWLHTWLLEAAIAALIGGITMARKARREESPLWAGPGRKFAMGFLPALATGALLTVALRQAGAMSLLPAVWLLLYGTAVVAGGAFSVRIVPVLGVCFWGLGVAALLVPGWADAWLAAGFGLGHIVFGFLIARRHGG